jgi:ABC-type lipoprotein export system ATPase subunit
MSLILSARNIFKSYGEGELQFEVIKSANLDIYQGDFVSIQGPSGAGKSTFLNVLGSLIEPDSGDIEVGGKSLSEYRKNGKLHEFRKNHIGFVFQNHYLMPDFTAVENVMIPLFLKKMSITKSREKAQEYLEKVGMSHRVNHFPSQLSGGESQRVAVARALVHNPDIVLADEPTGNLDSSNTRKFILMLKDLQKKTGITVIVVTHESDLAAVAQKKYFMKDGILSET